MNKAPSQLEKLKAQQLKLQSRIQLMEARTKESERKKDTRRKILLGAYHLDQIRQNNQMDEVKKMMDTYLKRNSDRRLFDLPELKEFQTKEAVE
jgi:hypothetical protein